MKLIKPSYSILEQKPGIEGIYEAIETAGRLCYKSTRPEGKTAKDFVDMLINRKHFSILEQGTVYLTVPTDTKDYDCLIELRKLRLNPYTKVVENTRGIGNWTDNHICITTNYRTILENKLDIMLKYLCEPTEFHEKRVSVHFTTSIGIVREFLRHRKFSFANESTRRIIMAA